MVFGRQLVAGKEWFGATRSVESPSMFLSIMGNDEKHVLMVEVIESVCFFCMMAEVWKEKLPEMEI